jgi:hypothetical protein
LHEYQRKKMHTMTRNYQDWLKSYTEVLSPKGEAPERFNFWVGVSVIAGVLRRRVFIDEGHYKHYPNFYVVLVGPPGLVKKSTTVNIGVGLLHEVPNVILGSDCSTWQSFVEEVAEAEDLFASGDLTEADLMNQTHSVTCAVTLAISEFGTFFDPDDRLMVNVLTELYDGKDNPFRKRTKTMGSDTIRSPFVNLIAGTTPDWIHDNFRGKFGGWGLSSRIIFLHCDEKERSVPFPHELWAGSYETTMSTFRDDLIEISKLQGPCTYAPAAKEFYRTLYEAHGRRQTSLNRHAHHDPWLSYYLARKMDHVLKLSIILSASRNHQLVITAEDMRDAATRCDQIEEELSKVFADRQSGSRESRLNMDVWRGLERAIKVHGKIEQRQVYSFTIQYMTYGRATELLNQLVASRWLLAESDVSGVFYSFGENAQLSEERT